MELSSAERVRLKLDVVEALESDRWSFFDRNVLLDEFQLGTIAIDDYPPTPVSSLLRSISDSALLELHAIATHGPRAIDAIEPQVEQPGAWKTGYVRLFISHAAVHRELVSSVADELDISGIHGFVAHDTMTFAKSWQGQIKSALRSMQAFVAIVHEEFNSSSWCQQEAGWALARGVPVFAIRIGAVPDGFLSGDQWPSGYEKSARDLAGITTEWLSGLPDFRSHLIQGLFAALHDAGSYIVAGEVAKRIAKLGELSSADFDRLDKIWWSNDQLYGGSLPTKTMQPFYKKNGRQWPPSGQPTTNCGKDSA